MARLRERDGDACAVGSAVGSAAAVRVRDLASQAGDQLERDPMGGPCQRRGRGNQGVEGVVIAPGSPAVDRAVNRQVIARRSVVFGQSHDVRLANSAGIAGVTGRERGGNPARSLGVTEAKEPNSLRGRRYETAMQPVHHGGDGRDLETRDRPPDGKAEAVQQVPPVQACSAAQRPAAFAPWQPHQHNVQARRSGH
jgi:hypothetical protein